MQNVLEKFVTEPEQLFDDSDLIPLFVGLELAYPPTVNTYFRETVLLPTIVEVGKAIRDTADGGELWHWLRKKVRIMKAPGKNGLKYRDYIYLVVSAQKLRFKTEKRLVLKGWLYPPDRRARDLDNIRKPLYDALEHAEVYIDDSQIKHDPFWMMEPVKFGKLILSLYEIPDDQKSLEL